MEAVQLASALTSLIGATCIVVDYVKKFHESRKSANELYDRVRQLESLARNIEQVVISIESPNRQPATDQQTIRLKEGIKSCFEGCQRSIEEINKRLKGFADGKAGSFKAKFIYVISEREIKAHRATVEGHIQSLQLSLIALNSLNDSVNHAITHEFLHQLVQLLAYLFVAQQQYQPRPANFGIQTDVETIMSSPESSANTDAVPAIEGPQRDTEIYFNRVPWTRAERIPALVESTPVLESRTEEPETEGASTDAGFVESVIDSPLAYAVKHNQPEIVKTLIESGQDIGITDAEGWTLVHHAVSKNARDVLEILLQHAQEESEDLVNARNNKQQTALMLCVKGAERRSNRRLAELLIEHRADVNLEDSSDRTALYMLTNDVARGHRVSFAKLLVENGATFGSKSPNDSMRAEDWFSTLPDMAEQVRRSSSIASHGLAVDEYGTSPESSTLSAGSAAEKSWNWKSIRRRLSSNSGALGP